MEDQVREAFRWRLAVLFAAAALAMLPGSGQAQDGGENDVLRIGWAQDPKNLNPFVGVNEEEYTIWAINWELLINLDPKDLTPAPGIAESWEVSEDAKTITFNLVKGAKWSDGEPITSADVKFSLETLGEDGLLFTGYTSNVDSIKTPDDETVVLELRRPDARMIGGLYVYILPEHIWGKVSPDDLHRRLPARDPDGRKRALHRHRVQARANPPHGGRTRSGAARSPASRSSSSSATGPKTPWSAPSRLGEIDFIPEVEPATFERLGEPGGDRDDQLAHLRLHRDGLQPLLGGGLPGREVQPRDPGRSDPPGHRPTRSTASGSTRSPPRTRPSSPTACCRPSTRTSTRSPSRTTRTTRRWRARSSTRPAGS